MKNVAICFSGHPRVFLEHVAAWDQYFSMIRNKYNLSTYFHCWADQGLVQLIDGKYVEGQITSGYYHAIQDLINYLRPTAFAIESLSPELFSKFEDFPSVLLSKIQASKIKILSQLYSISRADAIRDSFEKTEDVKSDVVIRMRFDAVPHNLTLNEIDYVAAHSEMKVLFAPSPVPPASHVHPGGGGGCTECDRFFNTYRLRDDFEARTREFLEQHRHHTNDICDLFAVGSPQTLRHYAKIFSKADILIREIQDCADHQVIDDYSLIPDGGSSDYRIQSTSAYPFDIESSPIFVPEKLIRLQMAGFLVVHGETIVNIQRR